MEKGIEYFMEQAMIEGRKAKPYCAPNPPIGCVIVKDGEIIAKGHTNEPGKDHAEAMALSLVPEDVDDLILFVTLEPCSFYGRTPSCAKAIIRRKIKKEMELEDKIIAWYQNELSPEDEKALLHLVGKDTKAKELFDYYQTIYQNLDLEKLVQPRSNFKEKFY